MSDLKDTPQGETDQNKDLGTAADKDAAGKEVADADQVVTDKADTTPETVSKSEYEKLQAELNKDRQEKNMLRNKVKRLEGKVLETDDLESIKEAYADLLKKEEEREAAEKEKSERQEAEDFRNKVISEYPESVQKAAKKLIEKNTNNLIWEDATDWNDARSQLTNQLDALKEALGVDDKEDEDDTQVHPNNPKNAKADKPLSEMSAAEMRKYLPVADSR